MTLSKKSLPPCVAVLEHWQHSTSFQQSSSHFEITLSYGCLKFPTTLSTSFIAGLHGSPFLNPSCMCFSGLVTLSALEVGKLYTKALPKVHTPSHSQMVWLV